MIASLGVLFVVAIVVASYVAELVWPDMDEEPQIGEWEE